MWTLKTEPVDVFFKPTKHALRHIVKRYSPRMGGILPIWPGHGYFRQDLRIGTAFKTMHQVDESLRPHLTQRLVHAIGEVLTPAQELVLDVGHL
jgi:hypothetical protein